MVFGEVMASSKDKGLTVYDFTNHRENYTDVISLTKRESFLAPHVYRMSLKCEYEKVKWAV